VAIQPSGRPSVWHFLSGPMKHLELCYCPVPTAVPTMMMSDAICQMIAVVILIYECALYVLSFVGLLAVLAACHLGLSLLGISMCAPVSPLHDVRRGGGQQKADPPTEVVDWNGMIAFALDPELSLCNAGAGFVCVSS
jgi:hypothetical protein